MNSETVDIMITSLPRGSRKSNKTSSETQGEKGLEMLEGINGHYYFKLKHNIQMDEELIVAKLELEELTGERPEPIRNFVDVLSKQPLRDFVDQEGFRLQDLMMRLPYCGSKHGYYIRGKLRNCLDLIINLAYFRDFYVLVESDDLSLTSLVHPDLKIKPEFSSEVRFYDTSLPYAQILTVKKETPKIIFRFIPLHSLYEPSDFICRLAKKPAHVNRMFKESMKHLQGDVYYPYCPKSQRWFKGIEDFMDSREAPQLYLTHYIFGIRGKFFPRMISAIMNSLKVDSGWILDPFCGCGTMNVEATIRGINNIGVDMQPLFALMSRIKVESMNWDVKRLESEIDEFLGKTKKNIEAEAGPSSLLKYTTKPEKAGVKLPDTLSRGVREDSMRCIKVIKGCIESVKEKELRDFFKLPLAYWMRSMIKKFNPERIVKKYHEQLWDMFFAVYYFHKFKDKIHDFDLGKCRIYTGDVRRMKDTSDELLSEDERIDGIITSPPYGTAIDYIGEHSPAMYILDLIDDHLKLDKEKHIGSPRVSKSLPSEIRKGNPKFEQLPSVTQDTLLQMRNSGREKKGACFYEYFVDMVDAFKEMKRVLRPEKKLVMIIGKEQQFTVGGKIFTVKLGRSMEEIGKNTGLDHLSSFDIPLQKASRRGAIPTEHVISFKKPSA